MLEGKNIVLRSLRDSDLEFLEKIENNKENWQFGSEKKQYSRGELVAYIANAKLDIALTKQYRFVIDFRGALIGFIDLFDYTTESAGVGIIITKKYRNKGFAKEALEILINYAFFTLEIDHLHARIRKNNLLSIRLFNSCGFALQSERLGFQYFIKLAQK
ncbi:MAG: GNAT family N-acetyltransferase [Flavobacteriales bacterium]|nr:GNAT family N-acetyltransferase [Flavobacteriales bacterium]